MTREAAGTPQREPSSLEIAMQWAELPAEHLKAALKALEPELARSHAMRMAEQKTAERLELEALRLKAAEEAARRSHTLYFTGLIAGFVLSAGMLVGSVIVGVHGQTALASVLAGPSLIALASLFVLRRTDTSQTRAVERAIRASGGSGRSGP